MMPCGVVMVIQSDVTGDDEKKLVLGRIQCTL